MKIDRFKSIGKILPSLILLCLIEGCAEPNRQQLLEQAYEAEVFMGDVISLPHCIPSGKDQLVILLENNDRGHVIAGCDAKDDVRHYTIDQEGNIGSKVIASSKPPKILDAIIDTEGIIHVLVGDQRYIKKPGNDWEKAGPPPWKKFGLKTISFGFVKGSSELF